MAVERPNIKLPPEYGQDGEAEFLRDMRENFAKDQMFDHDNHVAGTEDLQFLVGDQWDPNVKAERIAKLKAVLTVNRIPAFVGQVVGARMENETDIKVIPDTGGTKDVATVREGLMRSIQKLSKADQAYDNALLGSVACGIGNFQLEIDWEDDEAWQQAIRVAKIEDHFAVVWDRGMTEPTGRDASRCYVIDNMPVETFKAEYPWATPTDMITDRMPAELLHSDWYTGELVQIVDYWTMRRRERTIALTVSGATIDITDAADDDPRLRQIATGADGAPMIRKVQKKYACMYRCSGADVLEGPYQLPISRIPVFRVPGWQVKIGRVQHRWGIVRHMKDPQRLHNMWRSAIADKIMRSPKNVWTAADTAVAGREQSWRESHTNDDPLLIWNAESGQQPQRQPPIQVEAALIEQAEITNQDLKDVSNIHEANLGMPSNEVSGAAIDARQTVSETGTTIFRTNLEDAIEECGRTINEMIPFVYDTPRIIKIIGEDAAQLTQAINQTSGNSVDITTGKYAVTVVTGPSYRTKRRENAKNMLGLATAMPQVLAVAADLFIEAQDWPLAPKIAERIRMTMPPGILTPQEMSPAKQAQAQQQGQQAQQQQQAAAQAAMVNFLKTQSEAVLNFARAHNFAVEAETQVPKLQNESLGLASEMASRQLHDHLAAIETAHHV